MSVDEEISNPYEVGDWLELQDIQSKSWESATVIDTENNYIVVHFWTAKYDQKLHCIKQQARLRYPKSRLERQTKIEVNEKHDFKDNSEPATNYNVAQASVVDGNDTCHGLTTGNLEFEYFYKKHMRNIRQVRKELYYEKFVSLGYNDIELMLYMVEDDLKNEIGMNPIHVRMFFAKIEIFKQLKYNFKRWMIEELGMVQHFNRFAEERIVTFDIFHRRIQNLKTLLKVIGGNEKDCREIWRKMPKMNCRKMYRL